MTLEDAMKELGIHTDGIRWWKRGCYYKDKEHAIAKARRLVSEISKALARPAPEREGERKEEHHG